MGALPEKYKIIVDAELRLYSDLDSINIFYKKQDSTNNNNTEIGSYQYMVNDNIFVSVLDFDETQKPTEIAMSITWNGECQTLAEIRKAAKDVATHYKNLIEMVGCEDDKSYTSKLFPYLVSAIDSIDHGPSLWVYPEGGIFT
ncbi:MAG: hypothetical protein ABSE89_11245 [Sedimentisphaerales bacterium]